jgi:hypothetical protein
MLDRLFLMLDKACPDSSGEHRTPNIEDVTA